MNGGCERYGQHIQGSTASQNRNAAARASEIQECCSVSHRDAQRFMSVAERVVIGLNHGYDHVSSMNAYGVQGGHVLRD